MFNKILLLLLVIVAVLYGVFPGQENARERIRESLDDAKAAGKLAGYGKKKQQDSEDFQPIDLRDFEDGDHNGHTIEKHVGKSDAWLKERLEENERIPAASTFPTLKKANEVVNDTLKAHWDDVQKWLSDPDGRDTLNLRRRFREPVGRGIMRDGKEIEDWYRVVVRLEKKGKNDYVIWTAYPEE